jgi:FdhE protein
MNRDRGGFLQKWFGGSSAPPAHLASALADLEKLASERVSLLRSCKVLETLLLELFTEPSIGQPPPLSAEEAGTKLAQGVPLLRDIALNLDEAAFRRRTLAVCAALPDAETLTAELCRKTLDPVLLLNDVLAGRPEMVTSQAELHGIDPALLATMLRLSALPWLATIADAWSSVRQRITWDHGFCPTCGSWALLAESRGLEQLRFLRCGLCATAWDGARFRCVYCGNQDHHSLGYFHVEGEEDKLRAATCEVCHGYVKVISTLSPLSTPQLLVADLASLHLDLAAADRGYYVPTIAANEED